MSQKIAVFTSGGDAPGMNAAIRAVVRASINQGIQAFGIYRGFEGLIDGDIHPLKINDVSNIIQHGGTILRTARSKRFFEYLGRKSAFDNLQKNEIDALIAIGGDGTFTGASIFSNEFSIPVIGIPGTIDNDIYGTDYTIGYDTALNTVVEAVDKIHDTASSHSRIFLVEVMGREAGLIALESAIATGAEAVLIPEIKGQLPVVEEFLEQRAKVNKSSIIIVAEGASEGDSEEIIKFCHQHFPQFEFRKTILGHIQRGGSPSCVDRVAASRMGVAAVNALIQSKKNIMIGLKNNTIVEVPLDQTVKINKQIPQEYLKVAKLLTSL